MASDFDDLDGWMGDPRGVFSDLIVTVEEVESYLNTVSSMDNVWDMLGVPDFYFMSQPRVGECVDKI